MEQFDALIIGGGPAGSAAAILLAEAGWSVAVVERQSFPRRKVCGEYLSATNWPLLARLGVAEQFASLAGPPVRETAVFSGHRQIRASLPRMTGQPWGCALSRERLDALLLDRAASLGANVLQPARCVALTRSAGGFVCRLESLPGGNASDVIARTVIAAHGSWETGALPTQNRPSPPRPGDWLAFKAHFRNAALPDGLMPLLSFQDGYGGMADVEAGRSSLSFCIRRHCLARLVREPRQAAGTAALDHILESCPIVRPVLDRAELDGHWLSAGVIRPGIRPRYRDGVFVLGNAAGEAHPVVAEGISMAMQSAWLLAELLKPVRSNIHSVEMRDAVGGAYAKAWWRAFAPRIHAAAAIAQWASHPKLVAVTLPVLASAPSLLTLGARMSGKSHFLIRDTLSSHTSWCQA